MSAGVCGLGCGDGGASTNPSASGAEESSGADTDTSLGTDAGTGGTATGVDPSGGSDDASTGGETDGETDGEEPEVCGGFEIAEDIYTQTSPCGFDLDGLNESTTVTLDCTLDLAGATVELPAGVTLEFEGGDIYGGTLVFGAGGQIDGRLLSSELTIDGDASLIDPVFDYRISRWTLVPGETDSDTALDNNKGLEALFEMVKTLGGHTLRMDEVDMTFEVSKITPPHMINFYEAQEAVNVPSDFTFAMTCRTHLRIFTLDVGGSGVLLAVRDAENVTITGGTLHGDRAERPYLEEQAQEGCHLIRILSGRNVLVEGMRFVDGSKGGVNIQSLGFSFNDETYIPTTGVVIRDNTFERNRRMSMSITDGRDILVEGNTFRETAQPTETSDGGEVGYAINIEATRTVDENGEYVLYERAFDITIRGNTETGSRGGSVSVHIGQDVTIEDNLFETKTVWTYTNGTRVRNNTFVASKESAGAGPAIFATGDGQSVFDNEISGNTIDGYELGIAVSSFDVSVHDNTITGGSGIQVGQAIDSEIWNNVIVAEQHGLLATNTWNDNVELRDNTVTAGSSHIRYHHVNTAPEHATFAMTLVDNVFVGGRQISLSNAHGVTFEGNEVDGGVELGDSTRTSVIGNTIVPTTSDGVRLFGTNADVAVLDNTIHQPEPAHQECIDDGSDNPGAVLIEGNTCVP